MFRVVLLVVGLALAVAAGAWALHLHSGNDGQPLTIGVLEDAVKLPDPKLADERVALASRAGFNALNVTTAWTPGQTAPDPGELQILHNVARASQSHHVQLLITVYAPRPRYAPTTDAAQEQYATFMATLARDLPSADGFAVWNEPNLNTFWLHQYDSSGTDTAAPAYTSLLARTYDALKGVSRRIKVYGGNLAPRGFEDPESPRPTHSPTQFIKDMAEDSGARDVVGRALLGLAVVEARWGSRDEALELWNRARELGGTEPETSWRLGRKLEREFLEPLRGA